MAKKKSSKKQSTIASKESSDNERSGKQSTRLVSLAMEHAEFWHNPSKEAFATCRIEQHQENYKVKSKRFSRWLTGVHLSEDKDFGRTT